MKTISKLVIAALICLAFNFASAQQQNSQDGENRRVKSSSIASTKRDRFPKPQAVSTTSATKTAKPPVYRRTGTAPNPRPSQRHYARGN